MEINSFQIFLNVRIMKMKSTLKVRSFKATYGKISQKKNKCINIKIINSMILTI